MTKNTRRGIKRRAGGEARLRLYQMSREDEDAIFDGRAPGVGSGCRPAGIPVLGGANAVRWYPFLVAKPGEPDRDALFARENVSASDFTICMETESFSRLNTKPCKLFAKFSSPLFFYAWQTRYVPESLRTCYEIVKGQSPQKPYFDLDIPRTVTEASRLSEADVDLAVREIAARAQLASGVDKAQFMVFSSHSNTKYSYHIVITGVALASNKEAKLFAKVTSDIAGASRVVAKAVSASIDFGVYSATQQFRIVGCQKFKSGRVKTFRSDLSDWDAPDSARNPDIKIFMESLVTNVSSCIPPPPESLFGKALKEETDALAARAAKAVETAVFGAGFAERGQVPKYLHSNDVSAALDALCGKLVEMGAPTAPFRVRDPFGPFESSDDTGGFLIPLNRDAPSFCVSCRRHHETENPFMTIWPGLDGSWSAAFCCRRSSQKVVVGLGKDFSLPEPKAADLTRITLKEFVSPGAKGPAAIWKEGSDDLYRTNTETMFTSRTVYGGPAASKAKRVGTRPRRTVPPIIPPIINTIFNQ